MLTIPHMPEIGRNEIYYANHAHRAAKEYDNHARDAYKVGHYVTLAINPRLCWSEKLKYFRHALKHHCFTPPYAKDDLKQFYRDLIALVQKHAGEEALRLILAEDDTFAKRINAVTNREMILDEADRFFKKFIETNECPEWFTPEDYDTMKMIRNQWV